LLFAPVEVEDFAVVAVGAGAICGTSEIQFCTSANIPLVL